MQDEIGELSALDHEVIESLQQHEILSSDISKQFEHKLTFGGRLSDRIAEFGGSWKFILSFMAVLIGWILVNAVFLLNRGFDPYPFILLNLVLSCLAAIQAPVTAIATATATATHPPPTATPTATATATGTPSAPPRATPTPRPRPTPRDRSGRQS